MYPRIMKRSLGLKKMDLTTSEIRDDTTGTKVVFSNDWNKTPSSNKDEFIESDMNTRIASPRTVICRPPPYTFCYSLNGRGNLQPLIEKRPIRIIRVYK